MKSNCLSVYFHICFPHSILKFDDGQPGPEENKCVFQIGRSLICTSRLLETTNNFIFIIFRQRKTQFFSIFHDLELIYIFYDLPSTLGMSAFSMSAFFLSAFSKSACQCLRVSVRVSVSAFSKQLCQHHYSLGLPHTRRNSLENCLAKQFAQLFPLVCGGVFVRISPRKAEKKISVTFDIFGLERQIPHCVR